MKKHTIVLLTLFSFLVLSSCKKDKKEDPPAKTNTDLITDGTWKFSSAKANGIDVSFFLQACQKDNTLTFQSNGNGTLDEGATKCVGSDPQTNPFTWNFASNETMLHVSTVLFTNGSNDYTIVSLSETQLVGSQVINLGGTDQTVVVTFIH